MTTGTTLQVSPVKQIESLYTRLEKARDIYAAGKVHRILGLAGHYAVESSKGDGFYQVNGLCTCMDAQHRTDVHHGWCCHKLAVELFKEQQVIVDQVQVGKYTDAATSETERTLEDKLEDLYPKARPTNSPR
jgi:hypothetical protein